MKAYLDPRTCPAARPRRAAMGAATRELHDALDARARAEGIAWLHPEHRTIQRDLLGSPNVVAWQEAKAGFVDRRRRRVVRAAAPLRALRHARHGGADRGAARSSRRRRCALVTDCGMQAVALVADVLLVAGLPRDRDAAGLQQDQDALRVERATDRGDAHASSTMAITPRSRPRSRRRPGSCSPRRSPIRCCARRTSPPCARGDRGPGVAPGDRLDDRDAVGARGGRCSRRASTIVIGSLTKALGGQDAALGGYIATDDAEVGNADHGSDRDARRHPRRRARPAGRRRAARGRACPRAPLRDRGPGRRLPRAPSRGSSGCSTRRCPTTPTPP